MELKAALFYATLIAALVLDEYVIVFIILRGVGFRPIYGIVVPLGVKSMAAMDVLVLGSLTPVAIYLNRMQSFNKEIVRQSRTFLQVFPSIAASSQSLGDALDAAASLMSDPLKSYLISFSTLYKSTGDAVGSFNKVFYNAPREARLLMSSIVVAERSGGRARDVLEIVSRYATELERMEFALFNRLRSYSMIIYLGIAVYGIASGIGVSIARSLIGSMFIPGGSSLTAAQLEGMVGLLYYALMVLAAAGAYIMARIIDDQPSKTVQHFIVLQLLGSVSLSLSLIIMHGPGA